MPFCEPHCFDNIWFGCYHSGCYFAIMLLVYLRKRSAQQCSDIEALLIFSSGLILFYRWPFGNDIISKNHRVGD